ncbi:MAG TPA: hypothetical protein VF880_15715 [Actinomycetes bacterium]
MVSPTGAPSSSAAAIGRQRPAYDRTRRLSRIVTFLLLACLPLAGCGLLGADGQEVALVAGGGARLRARSLVDMAAADGTLWVLAEVAAGPELWTVSPRGELRRTPVTGLDGSPTQIAVDAHGMVYLATGGHAVWQAAGGAATRVVGDGRLGWSPDGTAAARAALGLVDAVAVGTGGELYFSERTRGPGMPTLIRTVAPDGTLRTVAGTRRVPAGERERQRAIAEGFDPPPGTPATGVLLFDATQRALAVGGDGTLYLTTRGGILAVRGGTVTPVLAPREPGDDSVAGKPFEPEARAGEVGVDLAGPQRPDLAVDPAGDLYLAQQALEDDVPEGFRWTGELGDAGSLARSLLDGTVRYRVRRISPGGEVSTAAWAAGEVTAAGDRLYLAALAGDGRALVVSVSPPR